MEKLKGIVLFVFLFVFTIVQAQKVEFNGVKYMVKKNAIFVDKLDVTNTLSQEKQVNIKNRLSEQISAEKKLDEAKKAQRNAEKAQKKAEKKQKKAENKIKEKEKLKKNYTDAKEKYKKELKRHDKLRDKGKLSIEDETKWQEKLKGYQKKIDKAKRKL
ncbi:hypothetical protein [Lutibacter citreus]|uniref:hypothetical protein n=1 Tax=Lutibacter citreus TaxID=2138210 RepID=UPI000DBE963A|nr:hypothetical protein [Lutibacter citreus]